MELLSYILTLGVFVPSAIAAPTAHVTRAVSQDIFNRLVLFGQFSAAAYCPTNNNSTGTKLTCENGKCPLVEAATTNTLTEFENSLVTDVTGYVATDTTNRQIVVAFRGSSSIRNFLADVNFAQVPTDLCVGCNAHAGFWTSWTEARAGVLDAVKKAKAQFPDFGLVVVGHSLGGAIADFAAAELRKEGLAAALYTYGSPRVGDAILSDFITKQAGGTYRVTHKDDPVPRLPPITFNYVHVSPEYYISTGNNVPVTPNDITTFTGNVNFGGNTGNTGIDINAHLFYFDQISGCGGGGIEVKRGEGIL